MEAVAPTYNDMWDTVVTARSKGAKAPSAAETSAVDEAVLECGGLPLATVARFKFFTFQAGKMHVSSGQRETCDLLFVGVNTTMYEQLIMLALFPQHHRRLV